MAIGGTGPVSLGTTIPTEFGGTNPDSLSEYYRNGPYVGSGAPNVPTSGAISLSQFYGAASELTVTVTQGLNNTRANGFILANKQVNAGFNGFNNNAAIGSRTPTAFNGVTIQALYEYEPVCPGGVFYFVVVMSGTRAKSWFTSAAVQGGGTLLTSSSTHKQFSSSTIWYWSIANYATWDGTGTRTVTLTP